MGRGREPPPAALFLSDGRQGMLRRPSPSCPRHRLPASVPVFQFPRIGPLSEIGVEFLELSSIKLRMKLRETGYEVVEDRSRALKKHELSETTTSRKASNE